jgi:N-acetylmuramoyl-L-alanine amidase
MTITEALLTNQAFGYPNRGDRRRHTPHILAVVHQTSTNPYDGQAMVLRNQRNGAGFTGNSATYYVDQDGDAVHAVNGTLYASWCSAPKSITYLDTTRASMALVKQHFFFGYNPNECVFEQFECVGTGTEPWTAAQFETVAQLIAARARLSGLPINRETVVPHRDFDTVNRPSDPWPAATREARMATLITRAKALTTAPVLTPPATSTTGDDMHLDWTTEVEEHGTLTWNGPGHAALRLRDGVTVNMLGGSTNRYYARIKLDVPYPGGAGGLARQFGYLFGIDAACALATDVTAVPDAPVAVAAAVKPPVTVTVTTAFDGVAQNSFSKAV